MSCPTDDGALASATYPNGVTTTYTYDRSGLTTRILTAGASATMSDLRYGYDSTALLTAVAEMASPTTPDRRGYRFDERGRLAQVTSDTGAPDAGGYGFDKANRLTTRPALSLSVDAAGQLTTSSTPVAGAAPATSTTYAYDVRGNRTSAATVTGGTTVTRTYGYDAANRLVSASSGADPWTTYGYAYDGDGLRAAVTTTTAVPGGATSTVTSTMAWDTSDSLPLLLGDRDNDYVYGVDDRPYAQISRTTGAVTYLHAGEDGSTVAASDATGAKVGTWRYEAYGQLTGRTGTATTPFLYAGEYQDPTGLVYLRARYYEPATGSFLTRDPLEATTHSPYSYVDGNPLRDGDPSGLCRWWLWQCGGAMSDLGHSASVVAVNFGRGVTGGLTDKVADWISPGASCTVTHSGWQARLSQGLGVVASAIVPVGGARASASAFSAGTRIRSAASSARRSVSRVVGKSSARRAGTAATRSSGEKYAAKVIEGGRPDGEVVFAGHGEYRWGAGDVTVPEGTTVKVYSDLGETLKQTDGLAIEQGAGPSPVSVYGPGDLIPNYSLRSPDNLTIMSKSRTVEDRTDLGDLLTADMGVCHWAACTSFKR